MEKPKYDVFISYRREGGDKYARTIQQALEKQYRVFLDFDELKDGVFDQRIIDAISESPVFLLILSKGALDRCVNENDWVRQEILQAAKSGCHIVPVTIDDTFDGLPSSLPDELHRIIGQHQFSELQMKTLFKASMEQLVRDRIKPYIKRISSTALYSRLHRIEKDKKYGFVNVFGDIIIPCIWNHAEESFDNGLVRVQDENGKWGFLDQEGKAIIPCQWNAAASKFSEGLLCVKNNKGKWGYIDKQGDAVLRFQWDEARPFSSGLANVKWKRNYLNLPIGESKWGTIDKNGDYVLPNKWLDCGCSFHEGMLNVKDDNNLWGYIDINGKNVISCRWTRAGRFCEGLACFAVKKELHGFLLDKWGFVDKRGQVVISPEYFIVYNFYNGITNVKEGAGGSSDRWKIIDKEGHLLFSSSSLLPLYFQENLASVCYFAKGLINGFVDMTGREVIPPIWKGARYFSSGLASVKNNDGKWGYIDKNGTVVIPCQWEDAESFDGDYAWVKDSATWYLIDKEGQYVRH